MMITELEPCLLSPMCQAIPFCSRVSVGCLGSPCRFTQPASQRRSWRPGKHRTACTGAPCGRKGTGYLWRGTHPPTSGNGLPVLTSLPASMEPSYTMYLLEWKATALKCNGDNFDGATGRDIGSIPAWNLRLRNDAGKKYPPHVESIRYVLGGHLIGPIHAHC